VAEGDVLLRIAPLTPQLMDAQSHAQAEAQVAAAAAAQRQARSSVSRAEAARDLGHQNYDRTAGLANTGAASAQLVDQARFERRARDEEYTSATLGVRVADSQLRMARAALGRYTTRGNEEALNVPSPIDGQVLRVLHDQQGVVQPGTPIIEIGDPSHLEITIDVLTADAVAIETGAPVTLDRWGGDEPLVGHVQRIEPSAFTRVSSLGVEEQRVNVVVDIDTEQSVWAALGDGYRVEARIQTWHAEDVLQVPSSALFRTDAGWALYRVNGESAERVDVLVGHRAGLTVQVLEGISAGESVIVHPSESLADGAAITARE
jgi:HlyD family secretion protein